MVFVLDVEVWLLYWKGSSAYGCGSGGYAGDNCDDHSIGVNGGIDVRVAVVCVLEVVVVVIIARTPCSRRHVFIPTR